MSLGSNAADVGRMASCASWAFFALVLYTAGAAGRLSAPYFDSIALSGLYDAMALGNHDFDLGPEIAADFIGGFDPAIPFLSANADFTGEPLLQALVGVSEAAGVWTLQASIFPENQASIAIHLACDFRIVGRRERIAQRYGIWRDTVIMERRSEFAGT